LAFKEWVAGFEYLNWCRWTITVWDYLVAITIGIMAPPPANAVEVVMNIVHIGIWVDTAE
tara:strand:- start:238 stop:417 length:180 start_codon:yes stop_codon:yes gene_type:complete